MAPDRPWGTATRPGHLHHQLQEVRLAAALNDGMEGLVAAALDDGLEDRVAAALENGVEGWAEERPYIGTKIMEKRRRRGGGWVGWTT